MILGGEKTATRRLRRPRVSAGKSYRVRAGFFTYLPHRILVESVYRQPLSEVSDADVRREGYPGVAEFRGAWDPSESVWVVEFRLHP